MTRLIGVPLAISVGQHMISTYLKIWYLLHVYQDHWDNRGLSGQFQLRWGPEYDSM